LPARPAGHHKPAAHRPPSQAKGLAPQDPNGLLEGFCTEQGQEEQIAVNSKGLILFLRVADIEWVAAADDCVEVHLGQQTHQVRNTLAAVAAKLPLDRFLRISPSTLVNIQQISELRRKPHGEYEVLLRNGARLTLTNI
jgi:two-component system LytT family response regulator